MIGNLAYVGLGWVAICWVGGSIDRLMDDMDASNIRVWTHVHTLINPQNILHFVTRYALWGVPCASLRQF